MNYGFTRVDNDIGRSHDRYLHCAWICRLFEMTEEAIRILDRIRMAAGQFKTSMAPYRNLAPPPYRRNIDGCRSGADSRGQLYPDD